MGLMEKELLSELQTHVAKCEEIDLKNKFHILKYGHDDTNYEEQWNSIIKQIDMQMNKLSNFQKKQLDTDEKQLPLSEAEKACLKQWEAQLDTYRKQMPPSEAEKACVKQLEANKVLREKIVS